MKVLITGAGGQLAWELQRSAPPGYEFLCFSRTEMDITQPQAVAERFAEVRPDAVINAAAYTAVDRAESEPDTAVAVNEKGAENLARQCAEHGAYLLQISTDFIFDGQANRPYAPSANPNPLGVYGASKLAGERAVAAQLPDDHCVLRTSWVYSAHGSNFVKTMLRLMNEKPSLTIVGDQIGTPTWAAGLATTCWALVAEKLTGTYHWSDAGVASWYDFAVAIQELALQKGLLQSAIPIHPIRTEDFPTAATRPAFSVLDKSTLLAAIPALVQQHWMKQLSHMLDEL